MPLPLYLLAVAAFAMGTSEFMLAGLVPDIAAGLAAPVATAGLLTSAFAAGMIVGAPLMATLTRRWPARISLPGFVLAFAATHVAGALTTSFAVLLATRVVAALANAGFLARALTVAAALVPADRKGRALAVLLSGATIATIAGVPGGALLGSLLGWRATFWAIAVLCLPAAAGMVRGIPNDPNDSADPAQGAGPPRLALVLVLFLSALVNAATFATFTFLAPIVTGTAHLGGRWVSVALMFFGAGSFAGVNLAGRLADRRPAVVVGAGGPLLLLGWVALAILATRPVALLLMVFVQGALSFAVGSTLVTRALYTSRMGGSFATMALNIGAAGGPAAAAATLPGGALGPVWVSALLVAAALAIGLPMLRVIAPSGRSGGRR